MNFISAEKTNWRVDVFCESTRFTRDVHFSDELAVGWYLVESTVIWCTGIDVNLRSYSNLDNSNWLDMACTKLYDSLRTFVMVRYSKEKHHISRWIADFRNYSNPRNFFDTLFDDTLQNIGNLRTLKATVTQVKQWSATVPWNTRFDDTLQNLKMDALQYRIERSNW